MKQGKLKLVSIMLILGLLIGVFGTTTNVYGEDTDISGITSEIENELKEGGFGNILYSSKDMEYATQKTEVGKSIKVTYAKPIAGFLIVPNDKETHIVITYNDVPVVDKVTTDNDWMVGDSVSILPIEVKPYVTGVLNISFTFEEGTPYLLYVGQEENSEEVVEEEKPQVQVNKPSKLKITKVVSSLTGITFTGYVSNISENAKVIEYKVYNSSGKEVCSATSTDDSLPIYGTAKSDLYYVKARAYTYDDNGEKVYGEWSDKKYFLSTPNVNKEATKKTIKANSVTLKWTKVKGASKYIVYCSSHVDKGFKKVAETKKTSAKITKYNKKALNLKNRKYFRVVAVAKKGGKTIKSQPIETIYCELLY